MHIAHFFHMTITIKTTDRKYFTPKHRWYFFVSFLFHFRTINIYLCSCIFAIDIYYCQLKRHMKNISDRKYFRKRKTLRNFIIVNIRQEKWRREKEDTTIDMKHWNSSHNVMCVFLLLLRSLNVFTVESA